MRITASTHMRGRASARPVICLAGIALATSATIAAAATSAAASVPVELRVATSDGINLADVRQYVPGSTSVKTFAGDDCIDPTPPFKQSSGQSYPQSGPTMLSAIWEAGQVEPALQPVRLSDADFASFGSLTICQINAKTPPGFFFLKANHQGLQVGASLFTVQGGEDLLAYRTPDDFSVDDELDLSAPVRTAPGVPVNVNVRAYTSTTATVEPRSGVSIVGADSPAQTDFAGNATVSFATEGVHRLTAVGDYNDIPSRTLTVCVNAQPGQACSPERGRVILGSDEPEGIKGTDGDDLIRPRGGKDGVKAGAGADLIVANGGSRDRIFCGGGRDTVIRSGKDRVSRSCEVVRGGTKKGKRRK
jgi:Ca2+-binding RTX toxin-like protein